MLPNFFVVGAQKAGTTSLHNFLASHPEIYLPRQKETKFFVADDRYSAGILEYEGRYFADWEGEPAVGEVDPDYMYFERALERMAADLDLRQVRFIFLLRNPVERAFSHYLMTYRRGHEPLSFAEALEREDDRIKQDYLSDMHYSYASRGYYHRQISRFLQHVESSQILFLLSDELRADPAGSVRKVASFLGISTQYELADADRQYHRATAPRSMSLLQRVQRKDTVEKRLLRALVPFKGLRHSLRQKLLDWNQTEQHGLQLDAGTRAYLSEQYREENHLLSELTGLDLSDWQAGG